MRKIALDKKIKSARRQILMLMADRFVVLSKRLSSSLRKDELTLIDLPSLTVDENASLWNNYDWSHRGEEWTLQAKIYRGIDPHTWKNSLINDAMLKYIKKNSVILEIGPGAGRWTAILLNLSSKIILVDISDKCLDICRERFRACDNIEYRLIREVRLDFIPDDSIDYVWSYDAFVHINPTDIEQYICHISRILRPGGHAIVHHADKYSSQQLVRSRGLRSYMNGDLFAYLVKKYGMEMVEQNDRLVHVQGDLLSVFKK